MNCSVNCKATRRRRDRNQSLSTFVKPMEPFGLDVQERFQSTPTHSDILEMLQMVWQPDGEQKYSSGQRLFSLN